MAAEWSPNVESVHVSIGAGLDKFRSHNQPPVGDVRDFIKLNFMSADVVHNTCSYPTARRGDHGNMMLISEEIPGK